MLADAQTEKIVAYSTAAAGFATALAMALVRFYRPILDWLTDRRKMEFDYEQVREKTAYDRLDELYLQLKEDLVQCRRDHMVSDRRCSRLEAALVANGIRLPPLDDSGEHAPVGGHPS